MQLDVTGSWNATQDVQNPGDTRDATPDVQDIGDADSMLCLSEHNSGESDVG